VALFGDEAREQGQGGGEKECERGDNSVKRSFHFHSENAFFLFAK